MKIFLLLMFALDDPQLPPADLQAKKIEIEKKAANLARAALAPICLGRCEILGVDVEIAAKKLTSSEMPGFEQIAKSTVTAEPTAITVHIAADKKLSPETREGLAHAAKSAIVGMAPSVEVLVRPFDFPQPRNEAAAPIVISMLKDEKVAPAPALPPPPPAPVPEPRPDPLERLLGSLADAAPWLIGIVLVFLGLAWLVWLRTPRPVKVADATPVKADPSAEPTPSKTEVPPSDLRDRCLQNRALRAEVTRRVLEDAQTWRVLPLLGREALADFHESDLTALLPAAYAHLRSQGDKEPALDVLETLVADALELGEPDPRFYRLSLIEEAVFSAVVKSLGEQGAVLLTLAPERLRRAELTRMQANERQTFLATALDLEEPPDLDALAARLETEIEDKRQGYLAARRSVSALAQTGSHDDAMLRIALASDPLWKDVAEAELATEDELLEANDETLDALLFAAPPDAVIAFLRGAGPELKLRMQGKLPGYLKAHLASESEHALSDEAFARARATMLRTFRKLHKRERASRARVKVAT